MMISIVEITTMMLMNINTPYSTGIGISLEGNMMILMVDNDVDLLEHCYLKITNKLKFLSLVPCREEHGAGRHDQAGACWEK